VRHAEVRHAAQEQAKYVNVGKVGGGRTAEHLNCSIVVRMVIIGQIAQALESGSQIEGPPGLSEFGPETCSTSVVPGCQCRTGGTALSALRRSAGVAPSINAKDLRQEASANSPFDGTLQHSTIVCSSLFRRYRQIARTRCVRATEPTNGKLEWLPKSPFVQQRHTDTKYIPALTKA